jgi:glycosyltransferase involved in cell wall biosynthesis
MELLSGRRVAQMKVGVIAHLKYPIREPFAGGLEMHTFSLCRSLRRRGHKVTLFAAAGSADGLGLEVCSDNKQKTQIGAEEQFRHEHRTYFKLMEHLRNRDFDIIHNNSLHYLPPAMAGRLPMPMVTVLHTPPFWEMEGSIIKSDAANCSFVAVSSVIKDLWAPITKTECVIHNGIDLNKFGFAPVPAPSPYVVWSGRIVPEKGLHLAILAARSAGLNLRIAGPISDLRYFEREIKPSLSESTIYVGHLSQKHLAELVGGAQAFLFTPLWEEPYGLVLAEALACGTPVVSFARGAVAEILDESCGIVVPPNDVGMLAQAAHDAQFLRRPDCRKRAEEIADADTMIEQYEDLYRRLILRGSRAPGSLESLPGAFTETLDPRALLNHYMAHCPAIASEIPLGLRS